MERMGYYEDLRITENDAFRFFPAMWPNHITRGCNFRCPFCHNSDLLGSDAPAAFTDEEVLDFLKKRRGILEGLPSLAESPRSSRIWRISYRRYGRWDTRSSWIPTATGRRC